MAGIAGAGAVGFSGSGGGGAPRSSNTSSAGSGRSGGTPKGETQSFNNNNNYCGSGATLLTPSSSSSTRVAAGDARRGGATGTASAAPTPSGPPSDFPSTLFSDPGPITNVEAGLVAIKAVRGNDACAECGAARPVWASVNLGLLFCLRCSGVHRGIGVHIPQVGGGGARGESRWFML